MAEFRQATRPAGKKGEVVLTPWASRLSFPSPRSFTSCLQKGRPLAYEPSGYPWISRRSPEDFRGLSLASVTVHGLKKKKTQKKILWQASWQVDWTCQTSWQKCEKKLRTGAQPVLAYVVSRNCCMNCRNRCRFRCRNCCVFVCSTDLTF